MNLYVEQFQKNSRLFITFKKSFLEEETPSIDVNRHIWISSFKQLLLKSESIVFSNHSNRYISKTFSISKQTTSFSESIYLFSFNLTRMNSSTISSYKQWFSLERIPSNESMLIFALSPSEIVKGDENHLMTIHYHFSGAFLSSTYSCFLFDVRSSSWSSKYCSSILSSFSLICNCTFSVSSSSLSYPSFSLTSSSSHRSQLYYVNMSPSTSSNRISLLGGLIAFFSYFFFILFILFLFSCFFLIYVKKRKQNKKIVEDLPSCDT
mmetsp:Transcript_12330/g.18414  ORF Transcript_12330/g.18414 Transcript_12330/m.18414 type:complete len:265 (+) Transcript_12330:2-796(+)